MSQKIKDISIKDLVLWTENPRDPVDIKASNQDIANKAIREWDLKKLFRKMGARFDQSEIPTVTYIDRKPVVYDGNRRVLIGKIIHQDVTVEDSNQDFSDFDFPEKIPCNVCDKKTALEHVDRKHADNGSWKPLERDIFKYKHMGEPKSSFLIIEEATKLISSYPKLNQRFVKEEIFDNTTLHKLGFSTNNDKLQHVYKNQQDADNILKKIINLVEKKEITTRKNRGKLIDLIDQNILKRKTDDYQDYQTSDTHPPARKTRTTKKKSVPLFGSTLQLKAGLLNNLYSDLKKLYDKRGEYSPNCSMIIRMGLRLLVEVASKDHNCKDIEQYISSCFDKAKKKLSKDEKTILNSYSITGGSIVKLLHIGAHGSKATNQIEQTVALSLIIGKMLQISHEK